MGRKTWRSLLLANFLAAVLLSLLPGSAFSQQKVQPIVIGAPLSTQYLYGWDAQRAMLLAVEEINAKGGVQVGKARRPFRLEVLDTRDLEPGVPLSEALLVVEKLI
ncbi:MAG: ABC transporter substrate-binding protein, partial [Deltaproteobacteria bacterium]|nr:ABC transporter substrate-binding protein [Deltaproteobacteria bacterium]